MAGVADTNAIDLVAQDADGSYLLVMIENRQWGATPDQEAQLRAKINTYAAYVIDGSLSRAYPQTVGERVRVQIVCPEEPLGHFAHIVGHATAQLAAYGIALEVNLKG